MITINCKTVLIASFAFATVIIGGAVRAQTQPNVLLILADDLGTLDLNCYGSGDLATPNLDRLAKRGVRFTQFYAVAPVCSPSRAGLLTGKTNLGAGLPGNVPVPEKDLEMKAGLPSSEITIAEMLKNNGYYTALVGKWHLGHAPDKLPNAQGFDYFFGHQRGCIDNYSHFFFWSGPNRHDLYQNDEEIYRPGKYFPDLMVDEIKETIDRSGNQPFFIYWAANVPHYPYQGTEKWLDHYKDLASPRREYAAFVSSLDERIGWVLDELEKKGELENTIIVFQSDHGHSYEERAFWGGGNSGPYRGGKFSMFEGGIRVPALISYPRTLPSGIVCDAVSSGMDWFPTIAALTGARYQADSVEGISLLPVIADNAEKTPERELHWQTGSYDDSKSAWAVRKGDWKLLGNPMDPDPKWDPTATGEDFNGKDRLFLVQLSSDTGERTNRAGDHPEKVKELLGLHQRWLERVRR
ncbi:sulfatase-like hydrolase/transferase [Parapedobacter indicus]|uniref:Arylsulfatase A n=1 Tax=Parapedobacter indicus TaxID=1477437 RepID=A0A1I3M3W7_9SPHI|nr:sulfatase-like hydrolase/transferase [Parapedobacter indicus]PPL01287.1 arylsulfatase A-like enzyme [Parapedobacter indicus]SFI91711.1 Arylsulfatase A [Parapedobacter indicus]